MTILSIDQSIRSSGVCIYNTESKNYEFKLIGAPERIKNELKALQYTLKGLQSLTLKTNPDIILIESLAFGINSTSVRPLAYLFYAIQMFADYWGIPITVISITSAKKTAGSGRMKKSEMYEKIPKEVQEKINRVTKVKKKRLDLSDSYWILQTYLNKTEKEKKG